MSSIITQHQKHESIVKKGLQTFIDVGLSLKWIKDHKSYKQLSEQHDTFESYCKAVFGFGDSRARQLIRAADVAKELPDLTNEAQARAARDVPAAKRKEVIEQAKAAAEEEGRPLSASHIRAAAGGTDVTPEAEEEYEYQEEEIEIELAEVDDTGMPIASETVAEDFTLLKAEQQEAINQIRKLGKGIEEMLKHPRRDVWTDPMSVAGALQKAIRELRFGLPYAECPACAGAGCKACKQVGWVPKKVHDAMEKRAS
jgi:hypothetical protein